MNRLTMERAIEESPLGKQLFPQTAPPCVRGMPFGALESRAISSATRAARCADDASPI